jgi:peptide/nickel transport system ATP-binding protein
MSLIRLANISYSLLVKDRTESGDEAKHILKNISLEIAENELIGIAGESGGGKTTLAKIIAGILFPTKGKVLLHKALDVNEKQCSPVQILFQNNGEILNPYRKIVDIIDEAIVMSGFKGYARIMERERICDLLGLEGNIIYKRGYQLSGGEQQRATLARLIAVKPKLLILDEPFSAQDIASQLNFVNVIKKLNEEQGISIVCISHDLRLLKNLAKRVLIIKDGQVVEEGSTEVIFSHASHPYTKFLLKAEDYSLSVDEIAGLMN